jgi:hypothetical protein
MAIREILGGFPVGCAAGPLTGLPLIARGRAAYLAKQDQAPYRLRDIRPGRSLPPAGVGSAPIGSVRVGYASHQR